MKPVATYGPQVINFGEKFVRQSKGRWAGEPLILEDWQAKWVNELLLVDEHQRFIHREAMLGIARKNGKSTLSSLLGLFMLMASGENAPEIYAAAAAKDQANIVFGQAKAFVEASPLLQKWLVVRRNHIEAPDNGGIFRVLASDGPLQHGLNPSGVIIDELWAHKDPELYYALTTGSLARENPLIVSITTAGFDRDTVAYTTYLRGRKLQETGGIQAMRDARFFFQWFEASPDYDLDDPDQFALAVAEANPSSWIDPEDLRREYDRLPLSVFRRLHLNQWTESEDAWITPQEWDVLKGEPIFDLRRPTYMGVDVASKRDSTAIVAVQFDDDDRLLVKQRIIKPENEPNFNISDVRGYVAQEARKLMNVKEIAYDPHSFRESGDILQDEGWPAVEFPQHANRMAPASETLYELITEGRLVHDGNWDAREQLLATVIAPTDRGGYRISKRKSLERIDFTVALAMAADRAVTLRNFKPPTRTVSL
jgi:phage terminase large subunit-like protein